MNGFSETLAFFIVKLLCMEGIYDLCAGVGVASEKIFLSAATLLVVPANLVQHWLFQVQTHVTFNTLKTLVISSDKERSNKMPSSHSLAWDYDLVRSKISQPSLLCTYLSEFHRKTISITHCYALSNLTSSMVDSQYQNSTVSPVWSQEHKTLNSRTLCR